MEPQQAQNPSPGELQAGPLQRDTAWGSIQAEQLCGAILLSCGNAGKKDCSQALSSYRICLVRFWIYMELFFLLSYFSHLEWKFLSCTFLTIVFCKHIVFRFTGSQFVGNLPQDELYLEFHPYLK